MTALVRFQASTDPSDPSGIATYTHGTKSISLAFATFAGAQEMAAFIDAAIQQASRDGKRTAVAAMRGLANTIEADT